MTMYESLPRASQRYYVDDPPQAAYVLTEPSGALTGLRAQVTKLGVELAPGKITCEDGEVDVPGTIIRLATRHPVPPQASTRFGTEVQPGDMFMDPDFGIIVAQSRFVLTKQIETHIIVGQLSVDSAITQDGTYRLIAIAVPTLRADQLRSLRGVVVLDTDELREGAPLAQVTVVNGEIRDLEDLRNFKAEPTPPIAKWLMEFFDTALAENREKVQNFVADNLNPNTLGNEYRDRVRSDQWLPNLRDSYNLVDFAEWERLGEASPSFQKATALLSTETYNDLLLVLEQGDELIEKQLDWVAQQMGLHPEEESSLWALMNLTIFQKRATLRNCLALDISESWPIRKGKLKYEQVIEAPVSLQNGKAVVDLDPSVRLTMTTGNLYVLPPGCTIKSNNVDVSEIPGADIEKMVPVRGPFAGRQLYAVGPNNRLGIRALLMITGATSPAGVDIWPMANLSDWVSQPAQVRNDDARPVEAGFAPAQVIAKKYVYPAEQRASQSADWVQYVDVYPFAPESEDGYTIEQIRSYDNEYFAANNRIEESYWANAFYDVYGLHGSRGAVVALNLMYDLAGFHGCYFERSLVQADSYLTSRGREIKLWKLVPTSKDALVPLRPWKASDLQIASKDPTRAPEWNYRNSLLADLGYVGPQRESMVFIRLPASVARNSPAWQRAQAIARAYSYFGQEAVVGYAGFAADMSAADEAVFDPPEVTKATGWEKFGAGRRTLFESNQW